MDSRQQFEQRFTVPFDAEWSDEHQRYVWNKKSNSLTAAMEHSKIWEAWQASRESLVVELDPPHNDYENYTDSEVSGACKYYEQAKKHINATGIRTK